ncbi:MAG: GFA family protein, partial [Terriglobia bacterium]
SAVVPAHSIREATMSEKKEHPVPVRGSCFCQAVAFEIDLPTRSCAHCHCSMCRRVHGAGYVTWIAVPTAQFRFVSGQDQLTVYQSSECGRRSFCQVCGSPLFCELSNHPEVIDITRASLHGPIDRDPQAHIYFTDRVDWVSLGDELPCFGGKTGMERL